MNDRSTFESRLTDLFGAYAERAPVEVDAVTLAAVIVRRNQRTRLSVLGWTWVRPHWLTPVALALLLVGLLAAAALIGAQLLREPGPVPVPYSGVMVPAGEMTMDREQPLLVTLTDGRVLIAGGRDGIAGLVPAEVFDPVTGRSQQVTGDSPIGAASGVLLDDGRVFAIVYSGNGPSSYAHLFDPRTQSFRRLPQQGFANAPPFGVRPSMARLQDGRVLVAGGEADTYTHQTEILATAMIFDPASETFTATGPMSVARRGHSMTTLKSGRVLVVGGYESTRANPRTGESIPPTPLGDAEIYDPRSGTFSPAGSLISASGALQSAVLPDGRVAIFPLVTEDVWSGEPPPGPFMVEIYDPDTMAFSDGGSTAGGARSAILMRDGRVLLSGSDLVERRLVRTGYYWDLYQPWASIYDPATRMVETVAAPRASQAAAVGLQDGRILFAGGWGYPPPDSDGNGTGDRFAVRWVDIFE